MKRILRVFIISLIMIIELIWFTGCETSKKEISASSFNGVYEYNQTKLYITAIDKDSLEYYFTNDNKEKEYGTLYYYNETIKNRDFDEYIQISLDNDNLVVDTTNGNILKSGTYKKIKEYSLDEFFEETYGYDKYYNSKYIGKFTNENGVVYIYQPDEKYVRLFSDIDNSITYWELNIDDDGYLYSDDFETEFTIKINDNQLYYMIRSDEDKYNYEGTFIKEGILSKNDIINIFEPYYSLN